VIGPAKAGPYIRRRGGRLQPAPKADHSTAYAYNHPDRLKPVYNAAQASTITTSDAKYP
jgi:hypothetical protein